MNPQQVDWLGPGAHPFTDVEAAPGKYYVPSPTPYQAPLPGGLQVQEAYPGQYYEPHPAAGMGALARAPYPKWLCAALGALAIGGAAFAGGKMFVKNKKPKLPLKKIKQIPIYYAVGGMGAGAVLGWLLCGKDQQVQPGPEPPAGPPPSMPPSTFAEGRYAPVYPIAPPA